MYLFNYKICLLVVTFCVVYSTSNSVVKIDKAGVVFYNNNYFTSADVDVQQNEDGSSEVNAKFELIQDVPNNTIVVGKILSYVDHKYELVADTKGKYVCKFLKDEFHDWFTEEYLAEQNMVDSCPITKGSYWFRNFSPRNISYPVTSIWNKSLSELLFYYGDVLLLHVKWYATLIKY